MGVDATEAFLAADATRQIAEATPDAEATDGAGRRGRGPVVPLRLVSGE